MTMEYVANVEKWVFEGARRIGLRERRLLKWKANTNFKQLQTVPL